MTLQVPVLFTSWTFWFTVAAVVVVLAASLLVAILLVARSIRGHALRALAAVETIKENTEPIWALQGVLADMGRIRTAALRVVERSEALADTVEPAPAGMDRQQEESR